MIKVEHVLGDRRDYFSVNGGTWEMLMTILEERKKREIEPTLTLLRQCVLGMEEDKETPAEVKEKSVIQKHALLSSRHVGLLQRRGWRFTRTGILGFGFGMRLSVEEREGAVRFSSTRFFWQLGRFKLPIPRRPVKPLLCKQRWKRADSALICGLFMPCWGKCLIRPESLGRKRSGFKEPGLFA